MSPQRSTLQALSLSVSYPGIPFLLFHQVYYFQLLCSLVELAIMYPCIGTDLLVCPLAHTILR